MLIHFDKLYAVMEDADKRNLLSALIDGIQVYEEEQANSQWLKSIGFKLPIIDSKLDLSLGNDDCVEWRWQRNMRHRKYRILSNESELRRKLIS